MYESTSFNDKVRAERRGEPITPQDAIDRINDVLDADINFDESLDYELTSDDIDWLEEARDALEKRLLQKLHKPQAEVITADNPKVTPWISVKDKLPENEETVLVTFLGFNTGNPYCDEIAYIQEDDWYWKNGTVCNVVITHWMPLPEPPKEGVDNAE